MPKLLLIDASHSTRESLCQIFSDSGEDIEIDEGESGLEAVKKYYETRHDLVIMGLALPGMDGLEALKRIKILNQNAKVIILTSLADKDLVIRAAKAGATDFIAMPFEPRRVLASVKKVLSIISE